MADSIEITLAMGPDGQAQAAVVSGATYEQAAPALKKLFASMGLDNLPIRMVGQPEQHVHGPEAERVRTPGGMTHRH